MDAETEKKINFSLLEFLRLIVIGGRSEQFSTFAIGVQSERFLSAFVRADTLKVGLNLTFLASPRD